MLEIAVTYGIFAWLSCWWLDLTLLFVRSPMYLELDFKFVIVTICLVCVVIGLVRNKGLFGKT